MTDPRRWFLLLRIPLMLLSIVFFLTVYNRFILNTSLQSLKTSLALLQEAPSLGQAESALFLVDQTLLQLIGRNNFSIKSLAQLQYAQGTLFSDSSQRPLDDNQVMFSVLVDDENAKEPAFVRSMDWISSSFRTSLRQASFFARSPPTGPLSRKTDSATFKKAIRLERRGVFSQAAILYEKLIKDYPAYAKRSTLKLRLGYLYQKMHNFDQAETLYRQSLRETSLPLQADIARLLLQRLSALRAMATRVQGLERKFSTIPAGPQRQQAAFELGSLLLQLSLTQKAATIFHEAEAADPEGELVLPALFKEAWCLRTLGRFDEALERAQEIIQKDPHGPWAVASYQQIAESYRSTGDYLTAAETYEHLLVETQDDALAAVLLAQTGCTYLFDLNDPAKAQIYFQELQDHFPASPFSVLAQKLLALDIFKNLPKLPTPAKTKPTSGLPTAPPIDINPSIVEGGTPLMGWLESFLPIFVDVFSERLAKYMQSAGLKELTRKYTEAEFKELVVRRVRDRFPGQVSDVEAKIRADGFVGGGVVQIGPLPIHVEAQIGIVVIEQRPHVEIHAVKVGVLTFPEALRKQVEARVNLKIDSQKYPLKVKRYELKDGYALIAVELVQ